MTTVTASTPSAASAESTPSVLVLLVVRNAAASLRECLHAVAAQTYPRLAILAVDDASTDGSHEILVHALGEGRVLRNDVPRGRARSLEEAVSLPIAREADFVLLLHDDAAPDTDAVARLVEATTLPGIDRVGVVGAKIVDWNSPRHLRDVGRSADLFGHPYSPLQAGEIDQGQFDRVLEVLAVDPCGILVAREVWNDVGLFDERLGDDDVDLDFGWRARLAGWRVLMTPLARVRHLAAAERDDRPGRQHTRRYEEDRAALAAVLKNYGVISLAWILPLGIVLSLVRLVFLLLSRRLEEAYDLVAAAGWNVGHLPGTLRRRRRAQRTRRVNDRSLRRFMESAGLRLPRWFQAAERILDEQRATDADAEASPRIRLRRRTASLVSSHPVIVGSFFGTLIGVMTIRDFFASGSIAGGALPAFPDLPSGFFAELVSAFRTTGLGGSLAATPALGALGGLSGLLFGSTALAQKVVVAGAPALAVVLCYRAAARLTGRPGAAVAAAAAYGLSALMLWSFSDGRVGLLVLLVVLPALVERIEVAFRGDAPPDGERRFTAGLAVTLAVGVAFVPGTFLLVVLLGLIGSVGGRARVRGLGRLAAATIGAGILLFPFVPTVLAAGGAGLHSFLGATDPWQIVRLVLGDAPGAWVVAYFLPVASVLGLALVGDELRPTAVRAGVAACAALALAWASAAGYLPPALANAPAYTALAATEQALLVAFGIASVSGALGRESFGFRQVGALLLTAVLTAGLVLQSLAAVVGGWAIGGRDAIPAAWAVVDSSAKGEFRVLWIGSNDGRSFPAPGGDPLGVVQAGEATIRWGLTTRAGTTALDIARPLAGPGADALQEAIAEIVSGTTTHGGALLAPFGIRYVVAEEAALPSAARSLFDEQADLDTVPATGLLIYRNAVGLPPAGVVDASTADRRIIEEDDPAVIQQLLPMPVTPLDQVDGGWAGPTAAGNIAVISTEFDGSWKLEDSSAQPERAFGWSTSFPVSTSSIRIENGAQLASTIAVWILAGLWAMALWITRKPVRR
jgi:GT2 family glycosyltransferase